MPRKEVTAVASDPSTSTGVKTAGAGYERAVPAVDATSAPSSVMIRFLCWLTGWEPDEVLAACPAQPQPPAGGTRDAGCVPLRRRRRRKRRVVTRSPRNRSTPLRR